MYILTRLMNELYGGEERSIPVAGSPEQAARRLEGRTQRWAGLTFMDKVIGAVTVDRVVMLRRHRSGRNGFAPVFRGRFELVRGRTYLTGYFGLRRSARAFMTLWFCFVAAFLCSDGCGRRDREFKARRTALASDCRWDDIHVPGACA